jgi:hypothetical protein
MLQFFTAPNLSVTAVTESSPWDFNPDPKVLQNLRTIPKKQRRELIQTKTMDWQVYSAIRGLGRNIRISRDNPPIGLRGLVVDYDAETPVEQVMELLRKSLNESFYPNFLEISLGGKCRLVWVFEREILVPSTEFCYSLIAAFFRKFNVPILLAGYDANSEKPSEMWTNGGQWYQFKDAPLSWEICFGVVCDVSKKSSLFTRGEVPLDTIAEEVQKRFPGRWKGDFKEGALGIRFWDETADNSTGCQVKPDGMLCFTGTVPFMYWKDIFGSQWVEEKRMLNLGRAAGDVYFDGREYWEQLGDRWVEFSRSDAILALKDKGISDKVPKGQVISDAERVLRHIQTVNRVDGVAPLVNYPPGIVMMRGERLLNIGAVTALQPIKGPTGDPAQDFPLIWNFLNGLFAHPELFPLDHFLSWLKRSYILAKDRKRLMGQAIFLCGPRNNGKTLLCNRIICPMLGNRMANPYDVLMGESSFTDDLFSNILLAINDEDAPTSEADRQHLTTKVKSLVVNPIQTYHAKFKSKQQIDWYGRLFVTLNEDPGSVGILPEVNANTEDKMMYFASQEYKGVWPQSEVLEKTIATELPYFAHWLLYDYKENPEVLSNDRFGVKSYFDPSILNHAKQQLRAHDLSELLAVWFRLQEDTTQTPSLEWVGTPTQLLAELSTHDTLQSVVREWTVYKVSHALTHLARQANSGITYDKESSVRQFRILRSAVCKS